MVAEEEYKLLKLARINRRLDAQKGIDSQERSSCLVALYPADQLAGGSEDGSEPLDHRLLVDGSLGSSSSSSGGGGGNGGGNGGLGRHSSPVRGAAAAQAGGPAPGQLAVVGTLDLHAVRALPGEVLIGNSQNAAYLANVCSANAARRRGVGAALLQAARKLAVRWGACSWAGSRTVVAHCLQSSHHSWTSEQPSHCCGCPATPTPTPAPTSTPRPSTAPDQAGVEDLYVHTMAVNEIACSFYERHGFVVEKVGADVQPCFNWVPTDA